ncbi:ferrous iron transport protein A [Streptomyces sp. NPDC059382]|uniref:ferrous iron transport protein A n=1 Tax=Streptomyces sp. NPDC059382 TaxID=3346816 RepID=UPI0036B662BD
MTGTSHSDPAAPADRQAIEHILGRSVNQTWPAGALQPGARVTVVPDMNGNGGWQVEFPGTIDAMGAPEPNEHAQALTDELKYWVAFDERQYDTAGEGPYRKAQIWGRYLKPVGES